MDSQKNRKLLLEERVRRLEEVVFGSGYSSKKYGNVEKIVIDKIGKITIQHLVVIALHLKSKISKQDIKTTLQDWGKPVGNWFQGRNMNNRLLNQGIIKKDGTNDNNEDLFSLTGKGQHVAKDIIEKIKIMK